MVRKTWIQIDGKLVPKDEVVGGQPRSGLEIIGDIEPFESPITGEVIRGRNHLRRHMKEHGVTNIGDYSPEFLEKRRKERLIKAAGQDSESRRDRIEILKQLIPRR